MTMEREEGTTRLIPKTLRTTRRRFMMTAGTALGVVSLLPANGGLLARAADWRAFTAHEGATLLRVLRDLFPHDYLADSRYAAALTPLDDMAAGDADMRSLIKAGVRDLDERAMAASNRTFADIPDEATRVRLIAVIEDFPFFAAVHGMCQTPFYNQPDIWPKFGYEGPSAPYGGYIDRGFNDLDWL